MSPLRETIDRWQDGKLSVGDQAMIAAQLRADPQTMREFIAEVGFDQQLAVLTADPGQAQHLARFDDAWRASNSVSGAQRVIAAVERTIDQRAARPRSARSSARMSARSSARLRAPRRNLVWWPVAAIAAAAALLLLVTRPWETATPVPAGPAVIATLIRSDASTTIVRAGSPIITAAGLDLRADDRVHAPVTAEIRLSDGSLLSLAADTRITLHSTHLIAQDAGVLTVAAAHRANDQTLAITTPHATATVVGTHFSVQVRDGHTRLGVDEGTVRFAPATGDTVLVQAGGSASAPLEPVPAATSGVIGFRLVNARTGEVLPGYERLVGTASIAGSLIRRTPIAVLALTMPDNIGPVRFTVDGRAIDPPQTNPPYSLTSSESLAGNQKFTPWRPTAGRHVVRAAPVSGNGATATLTLTIEGDPP